MSRRPNLSSMERHILRPRMAHVDASMPASPSSPTASAWADASAPITVRVHVYDLTGDDAMHAAARMCGLGIHHSGCEVLEREYAFGYHDVRGITGVFDVAPMKAPMPATYRETIEMGRIDMTREEVGEAIDALRAAWPGTSYDLLKRNCNSFTEAMVMRLTGKMIPGYVNRLATIGCLAREYAPCLLPTSLVGDLRTLPAATGDEGSDTEDEEDAEEVQLLAVNPVEEMK